MAEERKLYEVALRNGVGSVTVEGVQEEAVRQGALLKDGQVTTRGVLAEESRIIDFAREGKGTMRPMIGQPSRLLPTVTSLPLASRKSPQLMLQLPDTDRATARHEQQVVLDKDINVLNKLSAEQTALVNHVLTSSDQLVLVVGDAGTGKTRSMRAAFDAIRCPVEMLAPSADASRGVLRDEGFSTADTVASFLLSGQRQAGVKNGLIWVDEAGLLSIRDLSKLTDIARQQNARIILQGDPKQHLSVARHGNMLNVLQEYAGLPVGRLTEIWRQQSKGYKAVVADIAAGKRDKAFDQLTDLGWVQKVDGNGTLVDEYMAGLKSGKTQLVVAPTHAEGDGITAEIRARLYEAGKLGEDHQVKQLVNLQWTDAEKSDLEQFDGTETLVFHRNSGTFKAGQVVRIADFKPGDRSSSPSHFSVFRDATISVAAGDTIRITANGKTADGHKLNNGSVYQVKGLDKKGGIVLGNGWTIPSEFGHITHGYVSTSHASQGKTVERVLIAMGSQSRGAISAEQFYVSVSRAKLSAKVFTDMEPKELKAAIQRTDTRKSATELMKPKARKKRRIADRLRTLLVKARDRFKSLNVDIGGATRSHEQQMEREYGGLER